MCNFKNTKANTEHYKGKVYITPGKRIGKNIYLDIGEEELLCIAFVPRVNDHIVREAIMGTGYNIEEWLKE